MHVDKYYLDVVSPAGEGWIGYAVKLRGTGMTLGGALHWSNDSRAPVRQQRTVRGSLPLLSDRALVWKCPALAAAGTWIGRASAIDQTLWSETGGDVRWQVLADAAEVTLQLGDRTLAGLGYAERLSLTMPPWRLPIDGLRWGRFVSPEHRVVWIRWEHATPHQWLWHNGRAVASATIGERTVVWPGHALSLGPPRTLRAGRLADTVFAHWNSVRRLLPPRLRAWKETKWCAAATFGDDAGVSTAGWAIHEYVRLR